jgi:hypothetical protein
LARLSKSDFGTFSLAESTDGFDTLKRESRMGKNGKEEDESKKM